MALVFINGRFIDDGSDATVSAFDAGFQHAVGLFETMTGGVTAAGESWVLRLDEHLERLATSARELGLSHELRTAALGEAVVETVKRAGFRRARARLTITGGDLSLLARGEAASAGGARAAHDPTVMVAVQPATEYPAGMFERGGALVVADSRANPLNPMEGHKTLNYWWRLRELQAAAAKGAAEALVLQVTNHICGGCVSNLFMLNGSELRTPIARGEEAMVAGAASKGRTLPSPVLPGITRAWVMEQATQRGLTVRRAMIAAAELLEADEVFVTNSSWGVMPIVKFEAGAIADGVPGKLARSLREAWVGQMG